MDRNASCFTARLNSVKSLSARRAWIEIWAWGRHGTVSGVALRKESVDRNNAKIPEKSFGPVSLSARRAWIEIPVAQTHVYAAGRRSPQGERG